MKLYDNCWLDKKLLKGSINSYYIDENIAISPTIASEMGYFFSSAKRVDAQNNAELIFEIISNSNLGEEGYEIKVEDGIIRIISAKDSGLLYGFFALVRLYQSKGRVENVVSIPKNAIRMLNHWDNFTGDIERGYAGKSIFYKDNNFIHDKSRVHHYARMLASVGINAVSINNVNVHKYESYFIREPYLGYVSDIADIFRKYKIKLFLSVNYAMPLEVNELDTADPLDERVVKWWENETKKIYNKIPDFGGFIVNNIAIRKVKLTPDKAFDAIRIF